MKLFLALAMCTLFAGVAIADWSDNFDSYSVGGIIGQGGWTGWDDNPAWDALVTADQAMSAPNSVSIIQTSDIVQQYTGYTSGMWSMSGYCYIPAGSTGTQYFILLSIYVPGGTNEWCLQLRFNSATGLVSAAEGGGSTPIINNQWVKAEVIIDLDTNNQTIFYNDVNLGTIPWSTNATLNIGALDLFGNNASPIYWDDLKLEPSFSLNSTTWGQIKSTF